MPNLAKLRARVSASLRSATNKGLSALQTELVQERLKKHVQHLLKFGREHYDELQYAAVTADIHQALLINAGEPSMPMT